MTPDSDEMPTYYRLILETGFELAALHPAGIETQFHGMCAWNAMSPQQQADALPQVLGAYVQLVYTEEAEIQMLEYAESGDTFLGVDDEQDLRDAATASRGDADGEIPVSRAAVIAVLSELDLLRCRLSAAPSGGSDAP